jgi:ABC-type oligopeptide transport system substrate-binding subunit
LSEPFAYLPEALAHPTAAIIRPEGVGTGPYMLTSFGETEVTLQANPTYRGSPLPAEEVILSTLSDRVMSADRIARLGTAHDAIDIVPADDAPEDAVILTTPGATVVMLRFSQDDPMASHDAVREAFGVVIERATLAEQVYGGYARSLSSLIEPTDIEDPTTVSEGASVVFARELQAGAGWPDGFNMLLYVDPAVSRGEALGAALMDQLAVLYIDGGTVPLEVALEPPAFILTARTFPDSYTALNWLVAENGPAADDEILLQVFADAPGALTISDREDALEAAQERILQTLPLVPLVALDTRALANPELDHVRVSPFGWLEIHTQ